MSNAPCKILSIVFIALLSISCLNEDKPIDDVNTLRENVNQNTNVETNSNVNVAEDNELELKELINLPYETVGDSPWREDKVGNAANNNRVPGPTDRKLTAVLKFSDEDTQTILEKATTDKHPFDAKVGTESWFPAELVAKSDSSGDNLLKGKGYSPKEFLKSPYNSGTLIYVEEAKYFVLTLQTQ